MNDKKKERASNFTTSEVTALVEIVLKYKAVIECKKTDAATWREKDEAWDSVTAEFNSKCGEIFRSKKSIKHKYDDMKKNLRKKLGRNKAEQFKTGGGPQKIESLTHNEEMLLSCLPASIEGLPSIFDSDALPGKY